VNDVIPFEAADGGHYRPRGGDDAWKRAKTVLQIFEGGEVAIRRHFGGFQVGAHKEHVVAVESDVQSDELHETAQKQTGGDQQDQRKSHLRSNNPFSGTESRAAVTLVRLAAFHRGRQRDPRRAHRREYAEQRSCENSDGCSERQHMSVE
jgi:hypothetical protein